jgi:DNA-binding beta-propeller fold protein YncE
MRHHLLATVALSLVASACFSDAEGRRPSGEEMFFPTGLAISPGARVLYVANSDFDLRFKAGTVIALDLAKIRDDVAPILSGLDAGEAADAVCASAGRDANPDPWRSPGPCSAFPLPPFVRASVLTGAFASGLLLLRDEASNRARLFAPVRGDPSITYFDVEDDSQLAAGEAPSFSLACDTDQDGFCGDAHRIGRDPERNLRGVQLPADPIGIAATADGRAIVTAHQTQNAASLITHDFNTTPQLHYFASRLPDGPTGIAAIPPPAMIGPATDAAADAGIGFHYDPGFALTYRRSAEVSFLRFYPDTGAVPPRPFVFRTDSFAIQTNATGFDSRGLAIVDQARAGCEAGCNGQLACLTACAEDVPLDVFIANRTPPSLIVGQIHTIVQRTTVAGLTAPIANGGSESLTLFDTLPLDFGPSRVVTGNIVTQSGAFETRVFAVCFDSRLVFVIDPVARAIESVIRTGRGPHAIAIDSGIDNGGDSYALLYLGHFTDSYIGIVDLDLRRARSYGQMIASIGLPTPPKGSK